MPHDVDHRRNKAWRVVDRSPQGLRLLESGWSTKCQTDSVLGSSAGRWVQGSLPAGRVLSGQSGYVMGHPHITVVTSYGPTQVSVTDQYPSPSPTSPDDDGVRHGLSLSFVVIVHYGILILVVSVIQGHFLCDLHCIALHACI